MRRAILWTLVGLLVLAGKCLGQQKVGTTGAKFLNLPLSARAGGFAGAGVAVTGQGNWLANPACLGVPGDESTLRLSLTFQTDDGGRIPNSHNSMSVPYLISTEQSSLRFGVAPYCIRLDGELLAQGYSADPARSYHWSDFASGVAVGFGWAGPLEVSLGLGTKYIRQEVKDFSANGISSDAGLILRWPIRLMKENHIWLTPAAGISWLNFGPDLTMISQEYPLDGSRRAGLAVAIMSTRDDNSASLPVWELTGTFEHEEFLNRKHSYIKRLAVAFSVLQLVTLRAGDYLNEDYTWNYTYGYTLDSRGLIRLLGAGAASPWSRFSISLSQAFLNSDLDDVLLDIGLAYRL